ncbi:hypothetical protein [Kineococcus rhizosphaerae]|uniref:Secreted protein n=1 Tax=Kineococcus rhizosphaerae TaxID=559628 RepID=A0A2T0QZ19_9ACTN|nr:hypothetical protein [Kineococcus rhizosphaerae]PRY11550.1 hypothetical protein CLV37_113174 [Kineococcus rhizosphaerae]
MRLLVLPLASLVLALGACGTQPAPGSSAASAAPTSEPTSSDDWTQTPEEAAEEAAHFDWLQGGPMATSMPTRTCVFQDDSEEGDTTPADPEETFVPSSSSCFDPQQYQTESNCTPPPDLPEGGTYGCIDFQLLTQRLVDDWNRYADAEDARNAARYGLTLEEFRAENPDRHADGSPVDAP